MSTDDLHPKVLPTTRMEALQWATKWAEDNKIFQAPTNSRGYAVDGWRPPTPAEKLVELKRLAEWLIEGDTVDLAG